MIKHSEITRILLQLIEQGEKATESYRCAVTCMKRGSDKALFIHFWQEHAKILSELEDKLRSLTGSARLSDGPPWKELQFRRHINEQELAQTVMTCERNDAEMLHCYEHALRTMLPIDVLTVLKLHAFKIRSIQGRAAGFLIDMHATSHPMRPVRIDESVLVPNPA